MNPADELRDVAGSRHPDSDPVPGTIEAFFDSTLGETIMWAGTIGAPCLWAIQMQTNYALVEWTCLAGHKWVLLALNALFFLLALACGVVSYLVWTKIGAHWPSTRDEGVRARTRLMAVVGMLTSVLFGLLIAAQGIPVLMFSPCEL